MATTTTTMSDEDAYASTPVDSLRPVKRRRPSNCEATTLGYSSPDELGASGEDIQQSQRRDARLNSNKTNTSRRQTVTETSHGRSPSPDELDHTFYIDDDDIGSNRSESNTHSRSRALSQTPSSSRSLENDEEADPLSGQKPPQKVKKVQFKLKYELGGHKKGISQVAFSPDGNWIASASADATIKIWDASTGKLAHTLMGHLAGISTITWSPDSQTLASGSDDKTIRLWDVATGKPYPKPWKGHHNYVYSIAFSPKGNMLVSGSYDEAVFLWDVRAGRQMRSLPAHSDPVAGVDCVRDGTLVVSCAGDGLIRIWDTASGQCLRTIVHEDNAGVVSVKFSPNGKHVLAWTLDGCVRLWDYVTGLCTKTYQGHVNKKYSIIGAFGVYGAEAFIVSGSEDGKIVFWDVKSKKILQELNAHDGVVLCVDTHPNSDRIVSCGLDNMVRVWVNEDGDEKQHNTVLLDSDKQHRTDSEDSNRGREGFQDDDVNENGIAEKRNNGSTKTHVALDDDMNIEGGDDKYLDNTEMEDDTLQQLPSRPKG